MQTSEMASPSTPGATRPTDAVDVVLGDHRELEVDDVRQRVDVEPARGHFGGDEDRVPVRLEVGERADALRLALVAVDGRGRDAVLLQLLREPVRAVLGAGEDERLVDDAGLDQVAQQLALALPIDADDALLDEFRDGVARRDLDRRRLVEEAGGQAADLVRERGREQQVLAPGRQQRDDLADVADEAHVEHPVGLVEDEDLDRREVDGALADVVEQAAGRRDDDLGAGAERADLRIEADAAVDGDRPDRPLRRRRCGRSPPPGARARGSGRGSARGCADDRRGRDACRRWSIGSTKAAVLPVPVWAPAMRSRPARTSGIASDWTGVGTV